MFTFESRRDGWRIVGLGIASFLAIFPLCAWRHLEIIEMDLFERSQAALAEAGIAGVEITIDGRDLSLEVTTGRNRIEEAVAALADVNGIRRIALHNPRADEQAGN